MFALFFYYLCTQKQSYTHYLMKFKRIFSPLTLVAVAMMAVFASCSEKAETTEDKVKKYMSDETDVIVAVDLSRGLDAVDVTANEDGSLEKPDYLNKLINDFLSNGAKKDLNKVFDFQGFDWSNTVFGMRFKNLKEGNIEGLLVFSLVDDDDFEKSLTEETDFEKDDEKVEGYTVYKFKKELCILVDGKVGFIALNKKGPCKASTSAELINKWKDEADDKGIADWKVDFLKTQKVGNVLVRTKEIYDAVRDEAKDEMRAFDKLGFDQLKDGYLGMSFDLQGTSMAFEAKLFDKEGKDMKIPAMFNGKIDDSLFAYANSTDIVMGAFAVGDVSKLLDAYVEAGIINANDISQAKPIFNLFNNSTVFVAAGPAAGERSFTRPDLGNWHLVAAAHFSSASNARQALDMLKEMSSGEINSDASGNNLSFSMPTDRDYRYDYSTGEYTYVPSAYKTFYIKLDGQNIIISNSAIAATNSCKLDRSALKGKTCAIVAGMDKNYNLLAKYGFPFGFKATATNSGSSGNFTFALTGINGKLIPVLCKFIYENQGKIGGFGSAAYEEEAVAIDSVAAPSYDYAVEEVAVAEAEAPYEYAY